MVLNDTDKELLSVCLKGSTTDWEDQSNAAPEKVNHITEVNVRVWFVIKLCSSTTASQPILKVSPWNHSAE